MLRSVLVTGATGSFGQAFVATLLKDKAVERVCVYSRGEHNQALMAARFPDPRLRFFIGDVRDADRLALAMRGVDTVVHAAAIKRVDTAEYNPAEAVKTNVLGAINVIDAALATPSVKRVIALSTDKASAPVNLYGATKLCAEKLFVAANSYSGKHGPVFSCVRYGNVAGSQGSVIPLWKKLASEGKALSITDPRMTRFYMELDEAVAFVLRSLGRMNGGEVFIPRLPSFKVTDLAEAISLTPRLDRSDLGIVRPTTNIVGLRAGEKLHESLIGPEEAHTAYDLGQDFAIYHTIADEAGPRLRDGAVRVPEGFSYSSDNNDTWLGVDELRNRVYGITEAAA